MVTLPLPNEVTIGRENWVRMMYCMKHLMKLHPEYYDMIKPFYDQMYDKYPYNELDPFNFEDNYKVRPRTDIEKHLDNLANLNQKSIEDIHKKDHEVGDGRSLDELIWDLGMTLPSWNNNNDKEEDNDKT